MFFSSLGWFPEKILPDYVVIGKDFPLARGDVIYGQTTKCLRIGRRNIWTKYKIFAHREVFTAVHSILSV
jgi:hypothetical protein